MDNIIVRSKISQELVSQTAFQIVIWICLGLCTLAFILRSCVRFVCFRRLLPEDYLMLLALAILTTSAIILQVTLVDIYAIIDVESGRETPGPDFPDQVRWAMLAYGVVSILDTIGFWIIKMNFLLFFYRLAHQIFTYLIFWWVSLGLVLACGVIAVALIPYRCVFAGLSMMANYCIKVPVLSDLYTRYKVCVGVDVATDLLLTCFPILILWRSKISLYHKIVLSSIFSLVSLTIGVTIVRGSIFGGQHIYQSLQSTHDRVVDLSWVLFWSFIEFVVSYITACLVSFRSLWSNRDERSRKKRYDLEKQRRAIQVTSQSSPPHTIGSLITRKAGRGNGRKGWDRFYDSVLDTCADLEGTVVGKEEGECIPLHRNDTPNRIGGLLQVGTDQDQDHRLPGLGLREARLSQSALAVYCFYEENSQRTASPKPSVRRTCEDENSVRIVRPELAYLHLADRDTMDIAEIRRHI